MIIGMMLGKAMRNKGMVILIIIILVLVTLLTVSRTLPPPPLPANAPASEFSAERALRHIQTFAIGPHPTGSPANATVRDYIVAKLEELGLDTEIQSTGALANIIGIMKGNSSDAVLLTAHYDSVATSPGASDDGSGVSVLLETARALTLYAPFRNTVMFLFTDGEEDGTLGAKAFIENHPRADDVKVVVGFDAGGLSGPGVLSTTSPDNGWLIRQLAQADPYISGSSAISALAESGTDFGHSFKTAGFPGYAFDLYWDRRIHSPEDNIDNVSLSSIQHQGYHALLLARHFGNLTPLIDSKEPDVVYFSVLHLFTVVYSSTLAIPLAIVVAVIFSGILAFGLRRKILTWGGIGYGLCVLLASLIIAPLPSILLDRSMPGIPFRFIGRSLDQPPQVAAVVLATLALIMLWYFLSRKIRTTSLPDLAIGALVPMMFGTVGTSFVFPALSFLVTWPLLLNSLASVNWFYWHRSGKNSRTVILGLLLSPALNIVIVGPTILLGLFDQMSLTLLLLGSLCGFLIPQIYLMLGHRIGNLEQTSKP